MKKILIIILLAFNIGNTSAQNIKFDSLKRVLAKKMPNDPARLNILEKLATGYMEYKPDSSIYYSQQGIDWGTKYNSDNVVASARDILGEALYIKGDYPKALDVALSARYYFETSKNKTHLAYTYNLLGNIYKGLENYPQAKIYYRHCLQNATAAKDTAVMSFAVLNLAAIFNQTNNLDSALYYIPKAVAFIHANHDDLLDVILGISGDVYLKLKDYKKAISYLQQSYALSEKRQHIRGQSATCLGLARYYSEINNAGLAIYWAKKGLQDGRFIPSNKIIYESAGLLSALYESMHQTDSAFKYLKISSITKESLYSTAQFQAISVLNSAEERRNAEIANAKEAYQTNLQIYILLFVIAIVLIAALLLWRNSRNRKKALDLIREEKKQTDIQKAAAEQALAQLKSAQTQLIQSEKMASLGELTAGIAHEIQNPLNFVNNFSEVSAELVDEMDEELAKGDIAEAQAIGADLKQNLEKIRHHGKRADAIVKGMLQHSQSSSGAKEPTSINALADEYLRLSFHGLRSKDKGFNAEMVTHFDEKLPAINLIPQDIGRVFLNLFNNAFYAVNQKQKNAGGEYKPEVTVDTYAENGKVVIKVKDNGIGIPDAIKEKIMQPFFTTKPTGEGTGLGLSLTYDMVVKGHGGSIQVNSVEGEGSEFIIQLPIS